jgi:hypothetical protein
MWTFRSAHKLSGPRRGFFAPFFSFRKSTKSKTSFCFSGGRSRSFFEGLLLDVHRSFPRDLIFLYACWTRLRTIWRGAAGNSKNKLYAGAEDADNPVSLAGCLLAN